MTLQPLKTLRTRSSRFTWNVRLHTDKTGVDNLPSAKKPGAHRGAPKYTDSRLAQLPRLPANSDKGASEPEIDPVNLCCPHPGQYLLIRRASQPNSKISISNLLPYTHPVARPARSGSAIKPLFGLPRFRKVLPDFYSKFQFLPKTRFMLGFKVVVTPRIPTSTQIENG